MLGGSYKNLCIAKAKILNLPPGIPNIIFLISLREMHFQGKDAQSHVASIRAKGIAFSREIHGAEAPGAFFAGIDSLKESALLLFLLMYFFSITALPLLLFTLGWAIWKGGRAALLGWARLERAHRMLAQEKFEIDHNRAQEREELKALYQLKGFEGQLLEDVVDTLMADSERLLRIMVEEELGLSLENHDHPLAQGGMAFLGVMVSGIVILLPHFFIGNIPAFILATLLFLSSTILSTYREGNHLLPPLFWNAGLFALFFGTLYFLSLYLA